MPCILDLQVSRSGTRERTLWNWEVRPIIDVELRLFVKQQITALFACEVTTGEFREAVDDFVYSRVPKEIRGKSLYQFTHDLGAAECMIWGLSCSLTVSSVYLRDDYAPSSSDLNCLERVKLFLASDCEYQWPPDFRSQMSFKERVIWTLKAIFSLGRASKILEAEYLKPGDSSVWPFFSKSDMAKYEGGKT